MSTQTLFQERWAALTDPHSSPEERGGNYVTLTKVLKDPEIKQDFYQGLVASWQELTQRILEDITCKSCDHPALQVLGYCLYLPSFCECFTPDMIQAVVTGVCGVIQDQDVTKSVCTRALWTLANQKLALSDHVDLIVTVVSELVMSPRLATPTVDSEALNVFIRLAEQCPAEFSSCSHIWYQALFTLTLYGLPKLQSRALAFAISMEQSLNSHTVVSLLTVELKKNAIPKMLTQLSGHGQDHCHVLKVWNHVITVIGAHLHRQGSFLNELLRVVESGFKHRSFSVQVAAYHSWKALISNFSLNLDILVSQKRLKLLLMPLLASAARDKHEEVEQARVDTYWHLIGCLGPHKEQLFQEICVPFLMLCLGLDPKTETTNLFSEFHSNNTASPKISGDSRNDTVETPKGNSPALGTLAVTPTPRGNAVSAKTPEVVKAKEAEPQRSTGSIVTGEEAQYKIGDLLNFMLSTHTKSKHTNHYLGNPNVTMVMTGCHAFLQFIGHDVEVSESLIKSDLDCYTVYPKLLVPLDVAEFFLLFLDCLLAHVELYSTPDRSAALETVTHHLLSLLICCVDSEQASCQSHSFSSARVGWILTILIRLVQSGCLDNVLCKQMRADILQQLCGTPARLLVSREEWRLLLDLLLSHNSLTQLNDWFSGTFHKILDVVMTPLLNSDPLKNLSNLLNRLDQFAKGEEASEKHLLLMWLLTTRSFCNYITKTSHINMGTTLDPDLSIVGLILKFPFLYIIPQGKQGAVVEALEQWITTFDLCARHSCLVVKDPNYCTQLVAKELYTAYGVFIKNKKNLENVISNFDQFQNAIATVLRHLVNKISFSHLQLSVGSRGQGSNCFKIILSLLSWELASLTDSVRPPFMLSQLTATSVVMETVTTVYQRVSSNEMILMATEMLAPSLATAWRSIFKCDVGPLTKSRQKLAAELMDHVTLTLKTIVSSFQTRYTGSYDTPLLNTLSPLVLATLTSQTPPIVDITLTFWKLTFDQSPSRLVYPPKLKEFFLDYVRSDNQVGLSLAGLVSDSPPPSQQHSQDALDCNNAPPRPQHSNMSPGRPSNMSPSRHGHMSPGTVVVHPLNSPQKNVRGSFLHRPTPSSPLKPHPLSPAAKALDKVLTRSMASTKSHDQEGGVSQLKETSARRKLSLNNPSEEMYVCVDPPPKKPRLLTEHQKEKIREKPLLPAMYNALDHSQEPSLPLSETQNMEVDDVTHESPPPGNTADSALITTSADSAVSSTIADSAITTVTDSTSSTNTVPLVSSTASIATSDASTPLNGATTTAAAITTVTDSPSSTNTVPLISSTASIATSTPLNGATTTAASLPAIPAASLPAIPAASLPAIPAAAPVSVPTNIFPPLTPLVTLLVPAKLVLQNEPKQNGDLKKKPPETKVANVVSTSQKQSATKTNILTVSKAPLPGPVKSSDKQLQELAAALLLGLSKKNQKPAKKTNPAILGRTKRTVPPVKGQVVASSNSPRSVVSNNKVGLVKSESGVVRGTSKTTVPPAMPIYVMPQTTATAGSQVVIPPTPLSSTKASPTLHGLLTSVSSLSTMDLTTQRTSHPQVTTHVSSPAQSSAPRNGGVSDRKTVTQTAAGSEVGKASHTHTIGGEAGKADKGVADASSSVPAATLLSSLSSSSCKSGEVSMVTTQTSSVASETTPSLIGVTSVASGAIVSDEMEVDKNDTVTTVDDTQTESENVGKLEAGKNDKKAHRSNKTKKANKNNKLKIGKNEKMSKVDKKQDPARNSDEACNDEKKLKETDKKDCALSDPTPQTNRTEVGGDSEDPLPSTKSHDDHVIASESLLSTPTHRRLSEDGCRTGILKHISQFDTPSTAKSERRVQFAQKHTVHMSEPRESHKTPRHSHRSKAPQSVFSSRRTLLKSLTPPKRLIAVPKSPQTPPSGSCDPIYPSLSDCPSPIEQILPSLTASNFTHGLVQLVRARNITTVGNICSLSEQQVQTLPIKSPKVVNLRRALRSFEENLGSKRKSSSSSDTDPTLMPPAKLPKLSPQAKMTSEPTIDQSEESEDIFDDVIPRTPPSDPLDLSTPDSQLVAMGNDSLIKPHPLNDLTPDLIPPEEEMDDTQTSATPDKETDTTLEEEAGSKTSTTSGEGAGSKTNAMSEEGVGSKTSAPSDEEAGSKTSAPSEEGAGSKTSAPSEEGAGSKTSAPSEEGAGSKTSTQDTPMQVTANEPLCKAEVTMETEQSCSNTDRPHPPLVLHDHMYCSQVPGTLQQTNGGSKQREDETALTCSNGVGVNGDKLSLGTNDHTYCKVGVASSYHSDGSSTSQELFSCTEMESAGCELAESTSPHSLTASDSESPSIGKDMAELAAHRKVDSLNCGGNGANESPLLPTSSTSDPNKLCTDDPPPVVGVAMSESDWDLLEALLEKGAGQVAGLPPERRGILCFKSQQFFHALFTTTHSKTVDR